MGKQLPGCRTRCDDAVDNWRLGRLRRLHALFSKADRRPPHAPRPWMHLKCKGAFATAVLHLWHRENDRTREGENWRRLQSRIAAGTVRAELGLDRHAVA